MLFITCSVCGDEIITPGALVFIPLQDNPLLINKHHLCIGCHNNITRRYGQFMQTFHCSPLYDAEYYYPPSSEDQTSRRFMPAEDMRAVLSKIHSDSEQTDSLRYNRRALLSVLSHRL